MYRKSGNSSNFDSNFYVREQHCHFRQMKIRLKQDISELYSTIRRLNTQLHTQEQIMNRMDLRRYDSVYSSDSYNEPIIDKNRFYSTQIVQLQREKRRLSDEILSLKATISKQSLAKMEFDLNTNLDAIESLRHTTDAMDEEIALSEFEYDQFLEGPKHEKFVQQKAKAKKLKAEMKREMGLYRIYKAKYQNAKHGIFDETEPKIDYCDAIRERKDDLKDLIEYKNLLIEKRKEQKERFLNEESRLQTWNSRHVDSNWYNSRNIFYSKNDDLAATQNINIPSRNGPQSPRRKMFSKTMSPKRNRNSFSSSSDTSKDDNLLNTMKSDDSDNFSRKRHNESRSNKSYSEHYSHSPRRKISSGSNDSSSKKSNSFADLLSDNEENEEVQVFISKESDISSKSSKSRKSSRSNHSKSSKHDKSSQCNDLRRSSSKKSDFDDEYSISAPKSSSSVASPRNISSKSSSRSSKKEDYKSSSTSSKKSQFSENFDNLSENSSKTSESSSKSDKSKKSSESTRSSSSKKSQGATTTEIGFSTTERYKESETKRIEENKLALMVSEESKLVKNLSSTSSSRSLLSEDSSSSKLSKSSKSSRKSEKAESISESDKSKPKSRSSSKASNNSSSTTAKSGTDFSITDVGRESDIKREEENNLLLEVSEEAKGDNSSHTKTAKIDNKKVENLEENSSSSSSSSSSSAKVMLKTSSSSESMPEIEIEDFDEVNVQNTEAEESPKEEVNKEVKEEANEEGKLSQVPSLLSQRLLGEFDSKLEESHNKEEQELIEEKENQNEDSFDDINIEDAFKSSNDELSESSSSSSTSSNSSQKKKIVNDIKDINENIELQKTIDEKANQNPKDEIDAKGKLDQITSLLPQKLFGNLLKNDDSKNNEEVNDKQKNENYSSSSSDKTEKVTNLSDNNDDVEIIFPSISDGEKLNSKSSQKKENLDNETMTKSEEFNSFNLEKENEHSEKEQNDVGELNNEVEIKLTSSLSSSSSSKKEQNDQNEPENLENHSENKEAEGDLPQTTLGISGRLLGGILPQKSTMNDDPKTDEENYESRNVQPAINIIQNDEKNKNKNDLNDVDIHWNSNASSNTNNEIESSSSSSSSSKEKENKEEFTHEELKKETSESQNEEIKGDEINEHEALENQNAKHKDENNDSLNDVKIKFSSSSNSSSSSTSRISLQSTKPEDDEDQPPSSGNHENESPPTEQNNHFTTEEVTKNNRDIQNEQIDFTNLDENNKEEPKGKLESILGLKSLLLFGNNNQSKEKEDEKDKNDFQNGDNIHNECPSIDLNKPIDHTNKESEASNGTEEKNDREAQNDDNKSDSSSIRLQDDDDDDHGFGDDASNNIVIDEKKDVPDKDESKTQNSTDSDSLQSIDIDIDSLSN